MSTTLETMNIQQYANQFPSLYYALKRIEKEEMLQSLGDESIPNQPRQQQSLDSQAPYGVYEDGGGVVRRNR